MKASEVVKHFNSDIESYADNMNHLILKALEQNPNDLEYWRAWFEGKSNDELEKIDSKNSFEYVLFSYKVLGSSCRVKSLVLSLHHGEDTLHKAHKAFNGIASLGTKLYDGEQIGDDVNDFVVENLF